MAWGDWAAPPAKEEASSVPAKADAEAAAPADAGKPLAPAPAAPVRHQQYRPDIDGLRCFCVSIVLVYHLTNGAVLPGGFTGVDIFFVRVTGWNLRLACIAAPADLSRAIPARR